MRRTLAALLCGLLIGTAPPARAATTADAPADRNAAVVAALATRFLAPAYADLAAAARRDEAAWREACATPSPAGLEAARAAWRDLSLAYARVQSFRFGPSGEGATAERLSFWPERKNATAKGLSALLEGTDPITPERVARASAAAQGLPALERLAYGEDGAASPLAAGGDAGRRACEGAVAIAANVTAITVALDAAWNRPDTGLAARLARGDLDPALAPSMEQAASTLVTGFVTTLGVIQDQKLEPAVGRAGEEGKPHAAEAWRAGLSMAMIEANVAGLSAFVEALDGPVGPLHRKSWEALLERVGTQARAVPDFPAGLAAPGPTRDAAQALLARVKSVRAILEDEVPVALGLKLGFNGLDGD